MSRPSTLTAGTLRLRPLPHPGDDADKETRGHLLVVAGSRETPGAALLAATAALRAGAGKLTVATPCSVALPLAMALPEARVIALPETASGGPAPEGMALLVHLMDRVAAIVVGPGLLDEPACAAFTCRLMDATDAAMVLDAYAMSAAHQRPLAPRVLLTPHHGEMAHLLGVAKHSVADDALGQARNAARHWNACVALKGADTCVAMPDGTCWHHRGAQPGLATSGSGDTLAGLIGGLAARGASVIDAALWGIVLHNQAGAALGERVGPLGYLARELPDEVPRLMQILCAPTETEAHQPAGRSDTNETRRAASVSSA